MTKIEQIINERLINLGCKIVDIESTIDKLHLQRFTLNKQLEELSITEQVYEQDLRLVTAQQELLESLCSEIEYYNHYNEQDATVPDDTLSTILLDHMTQEDVQKCLKTGYIGQIVLPPIFTTAEASKKCQHDCECCDLFPDPPIAPTSCAGCFHTYESGCPGKTTPCSQFAPYSDEGDYNTICDECRLAYTGECSDMDLCVSDCIRFISVNDADDSQEDSAIQTAEDLANTIADEDKPKSLVLAQLTLFSDEDVEAAICSAIGEYAASSPQSHFSRFYVRSFIDHLENNLGNVCDIDYETAVLALEMNKGVTRVYEAVWERLN